MAYMLSIPTSPIGAIITTHTQMSPYSLYSNALYKEMGAICVHTQPSQVQSSLVQTPQSWETESKNGRPVMFSLPFWLLSVWKVPWAAERKERSIVTKWEDINFHDRF